MKTKIKATILAGTFLVTTVLPATVLAGQGGKTGGQAIHRQTQNDPLRWRHRQGRRDGSCLEGDNQPSRAMEKNGYTYGPGDGTGNETPPPEGNGYGESSQR